MSEKKHLVSVVIPVKDCEKTMPDLMKSLQKQDYPNYEVIVVDSSSDKTPKIVEKHGFRLVKIPKTRKRNTNIARNIGWKKARGNIVAFTDGDCKVSSNWLSELVKGFDSDEIAVTGGGIKRWGESFFSRYHDWAYRSGIPKIEKEVIFDEKLYADKQSFSDYELIVGMNMAIRKKVLRKVEGFDENMHYLEENEIFWRIIKKGYKLKTTPKAIIFHKHASDFKTCVKKYFSSGRGVGMFIRRYPKSDFSKHRLRLLLAFAFFLISLPIVSVYNLFLGLGFFLAPLLLTASYSVKKSFKENSLEPLLYPLIDYILCGYSYHFGIAHGLLFKDST
ncbi:MAG: glycosyltransferase [Nanoarchaeota archaeon]|nr:glycosyltransferase [Nanoarchaeota archaeon]